MGSCVYWLQIVYGYYLTFTFLCWVFAFSSEGFKSHISFFFFNKQTNVDVG